MFEGRPGEGGRGRKMTSHGIGLGVGGFRDTFWDRWIPFYRTPVADGASEQQGVISWRTSRHTQEVPENSEDIFEPLSTISEQSCWQTLRTVTHSK